MNNKKKGIVIIISILGLLLLYGFQNFGKKKNSYQQFYIDNVVETSSQEENKNNLEKEVGKIKVHIIGEVNEPGLIELEEGSRIYDAIQLAGGLTNEADTSKTNLAYILSDGEKIYIPNVNDENAEMKNLLENNKVNINNANVSELKTIPGVGDSTAIAIVEYRTKNRKVYVD